MKIGIGIAVYLVIMTFVGLIVMGVDKANARTKRRRIPEKMLFLISFIGGSLGTFLGMKLFHHKTRHISFVIGMPAILVLHVVALCILFAKGIITF